MKNKKPGDADRLVDAIHDLRVGLHSDAYALRERLVALQFSVDDLVKTITCQSRLTLGAIEDLSSVPLRLWEITRAIQQATSKKPSLYERLRLWFATLRWRRDAKKAAAQTEELKQHVLENYNCKRWSR